MSLSSPSLDKLQALYERHAAQQGYVVLGAESFDEFVAGPGERVVLFADDPRKVPETWDVAVLLPELVACAAGRLSVGLLAPDPARALAPRYGVNRWPALVFFRDGGYVGVIDGMRDWGVFASEVPAMLARPVSRPPGIGIPVAAGNSSTCH